MSDEPAGEVTVLLHRWRAGDPRALNELFPLVQEELRKMARQRLRREPRGQSLQPTELVHEAYLRIAGAGGIDWEGRAHFLAVGASVMRRILVDRARRKKARNAAGRISIEADALA